MRHKHVHLDFEIPEWIAELIIAKLDDESMREHFEASKLDVNEQAEGRQKANRLADVKALFEHSARAQRHGFANNGAFSDQRGSSGNSSIVQMESHKLVPLMLAFLMVSILMAGGAIAFALASYDAQKQSERETRMLEYYVMELDGKLMKSGIIDSKESWSAKKGKQE